MAYPETYKIGAWKDCQIDISDSTTLSDEVDLGHDFTHLLVLVPAITAAQLSARVAKSAGGTYYPVYFFHDNNADTDILQATLSETTSKAIVFEIGAARFIKIYSGTAQEADRDFYVRGFNL